MGVMRYVGFFVAGLYLFIGVIVLWRANELINYPSSYSIPLGCLLIAYGLFRGYRVYHRYFEN